jgi:hypothetical protein
MSAIDTLKSFDGVTIFNMSYVTVLLFFVCRIFMQDKKAWKILKFGYPVATLLMCSLITSIILVKYI